MKLVDLPKGTLFQRPSSEKPDAGLVNEAILEDGQYAINPDSVVAIRRSDVATILYCANARFIIPYPESTGFMQKLVSPDNFVHDCEIDD